MSVFFTAGAGRKVGDALARAPATGVRLARPTAAWPWLREAAARHGIILSRVPGDSAWSIASVVTAPTSSVSLHSSVSRSARGRIMRAPTCYSEEPRPRPARPILSVGVVGCHATPGAGPRRVPRLPRWSSKGRAPAVLGKTSVCISVPRGAGRPAHGFLGPARKSFFKRFNLQRWLPPRSSICIMSICGTDLTKFYCRDNLISEAGDGLAPVRGSRE